MGEDGKKPEDKKKAEEGKKSEDATVEDEKPKAVEEKKDGGGGELGDNTPGTGKKEGVDEGKGETPSTPPEEIILRVFMHCEGCARKVKRSLKGFDGVEDVTTDCRTHKVVIKGKKAAEDPLKVAERVQKKSGRKVELLIPLPSPKTEIVEKNEEKPKPEKEAQPVTSVILNVHMHCEACAQEIKKRILRMKGVQAADPDLKSSQVLVKGIIDPAKLVDYVYKRTGKHAFIVKSEPVEKKPDSDATVVVDEKSKSATASDGTKADDQKKAEEEKVKDGGVDNGDDKEKDGGSSEDVAVSSGKVLELKKNEFYHYPRYASEFHSYAPQLFSDENPNACSVM